MFPQLSRPARRTALLIAILSAVGLGVQISWLGATRGDALTPALWDAARSFTLLTHALVVISFAIVSRPLRNGVSEPWLAALTLSTVMTGALYHLFMSRLGMATGLGALADHALHSLAPALILIWWLGHAPKRRLEFADLPMFILWPSVYSAYALARGASDGAYPYPFLDPTLIGSGPVVMNIAGLLVLFLLGGVMMISIGQYTDR